MWEQKIVVRGNHLSVRLLTGLSCIPKLEFREAVESPEFDFWYPDQWVTFNLTDSILSEKERFAIIDAAQKGTLIFGILPIYVKMRLQSIKGFVFLQRIQFIMN